VDEIIFGTTNEMLYEDFSKLMQTKLNMSMMGELQFLLGLQIKQTTNGIYIHQPSI